MQIFHVFFAKYLHISKKCSTFASAFVLKARVLTKTKNNPPLNWGPRRKHANVCGGESGGTRRLYAAKRHPMRPRCRTRRAFSSAGLEHLPYKQRVCGSNP